MDDESHSHSTEPLHSESSAERRDHEIIRTERFQLATPLPRIVPRKLKSIGIVNSVVRQGVLKNLSGGEDGAKREQILVGLKRQSLWD